MPWQQMLVDVGLELLEDGRPAYREIIFSLPRQQGKTTLHLAIEVHRAIFWRERAQRIYYSAQTGQEAAKKLLKDQAPMLKQSALSAFVERIYQAIGNEAITFKNGSRIEVIRGGEAAGHGITPDLGILDEAWADVDERREQAVRPAMATRPDAQLWISSTAGNEGSAYLRRKVNAGQAAVIDGVDHGVAYFEWSADQDADIEDPATWYSCMPALGRIIREDTIAHDLHSMNEADFRRAYLNQWTVNEDRVIPAVLWNEVSRPDVAPAEKGLTFGVDVSADRTHAAIVAIDNAAVAELVEYRDGVQGLADRVAELANRHLAPVALDSKGPASNIVADLELRGVDVRSYDTALLAKGTTNLYDAIADRKLRVRSNPILDQAVGAARKRVVGDQWIWARRDANADIAPLVALTLAYDCAVSIERQGGTLWAVYG